MNDHSIVWYRKKYHKRASVLSTGYDILSGIFYSSYIIMNKKVDFIHARSYVPAMIAFSIKKLLKTKYIFDMRGFWVDERVDGGIWKKNSVIYRLAKEVEHNLIRGSDQIVTLTKSANQELVSNYSENEVPPICVIPTCADLKRFRPFKNNEKEQENGHLLLGYVGSVGTWYLFDKVLYVLNEIKNSGRKVKLLIVNQSQHKQIKEEMVINNINNNDIILVSSDHCRVHKYIKMMDAGIFFYKPSYSRKGCSPTKFAEFLGCGIPCITNGDVGDINKIIHDNDLGVVIDSFEKSEVNTKIDEFYRIISSIDISERCRYAAKKYYSLDYGVKKYNSIYLNMRD